MPKFSRIIPSACRGLFALSLAWLVTGCHLNQPASASFASVVIPNHTRAEIGDAATAVFNHAGYESHTGGPELVFEREGTQKNQIAHGAWLSDTPVRERVRAQVVPVAGGAFRLQCKAYMVRYAGDAYFEEEVKLANFRSGPYQDLLDEVARRLK